MTTSAPRYINAKGVTHLEFFAVNLLNAEQISLCEVWLELRRQERAR